MRRLRIQFLRAELELRRLKCDSLAHAFERRPLTYEQKSELFRRWEDALKQSHLLQGLLDLLEREEKEAARRGNDQQVRENPDRFTFLTWFYHAKDRTRTT